MDKGEPVRAPVLCRLPRRTRLRAAIGSVGRRGHRAGHDPVLDPADRCLVPRRSATEALRPARSRAGLLRRRTRGVAKRRAGRHQYPSRRLAAGCGLVMVGRDYLVPEHVEPGIRYPAFGHPAFDRRHRVVRDQLADRRDRKLQAKRGFAGLARSGALAYHRWQRDRIRRLQLAFGKRLDLVGVDLHFRQPGIAVLLGTVVLNEPFSRMMLLGAGLVIVSVIVTWLAERSTSRPTNEKSNPGIGH